MLSMRSSAIANVAVQDFDTHIEDAETVLTGMVREGRQGQVILVVETSLKGAGKPNEEIVIDENSRLAWRHVPGGGPMPPTSYADFVQQIQQSDWYQKRVVLVGSIKNGKWISYCYDWSVWTSGLSTRKEALKGLSFEELVKAIKSKLGESTATHQVKTASQGTRAEKPAIAPNPQPPVVQPTESKKTFAPRPVTPPPSDEPASSTPWSMIVVLTVAALGLLWLLLKRRS
ncbi:MAG: hypothetical protein WAW39_21220 [Prosthecobacter sp.]